MENFLCLSTRYYESRDLCDRDSWSPISGCQASEIEVVFLEGSMEKSAWGCFLSVRCLANKSWCSSTWACVTSISTFITAWHSPCMHPIFPFVWVMERHLDWIIYKDLLSKAAPVHGAERLESRLLWKKHKATYTGSKTMKDTKSL